jgi:hypothetical protein
LPLAGCTEKHDGRQNSSRCRRPEPSARRRLRVACACPAERDWPTWRRVWPRHRSCRQKA